MKRWLISLFVLALLSLGITPSQATISFVNSATGTNTCTMPAHQAGDLMIMYGYRNTTTAPSLPSTWNNITNSTGTTSSQRAVFKIAASTSDTAGTLTNATATICEIWRSSNYATGGSLFVGSGAAHSAGTTLTITYPTVTPIIHSDNTSWVVGFLGTSSASNGITTAPTGMSNRTSVIQAGTTTEAAAQDTNGTVSSWTSTNVTISGSNANWDTITLEIIENLPGSYPSNIVQHVSYETGQFIQGTAGTAYTYTLPNAVLSNNCIVAAVASPNGTALNSITDDKSDTWSTTPVVSDDGGASNMMLKVYTLASATAGMQAITFTFAAAIHPVKVWLTELSGVSCTNNGTATTSGAGSNTNGVIAPGSMTPTNNNANGGNLIMSYSFDINVTGGGNPLQIFAETGYNLNDADMSWDQGQGDASMSQEWLQATSAATTTRFYISGLTADTFLVASVALSIDNTHGTAKPTSGIHIDKMLYFGNVSNKSSWLLKIPTGAAGADLLVCTSFFSTVAAPTWTNAVESDGVTWTKIEPATDQPTFWYRPNVASSPNRMLTNTLGSTGNPAQLTCYDVSGAATSSPLDTSAGSSGLVLSGLTSIANAPSITPSAANELTIAFFQNGLGPTTGITAPTGAVFDSPQYTGQDDSNPINFGNGTGHLYNSGTSAQSWTWTITNQASNSGSATAAIFKAAPAPSGTTPLRTLMGVGGWLLRRDIGEPANDNWPAWLNKAG